MRKPFETEDTDDDARYPDPGADVSAAIIGIFADVPFLRLDDVVRLISASPGGAAGATDTAGIRVRRGTRGDVERTLRALVNSRLLMSLSNHRFALNRREDSPLAVPPRAALMSDRLLGLIATKSMEVDEIARFLDVREEAVERALATAQFAGKIEQFKVPGRGVFWRAVHFKAAARRARLSNKARLLLASLPSDGEVDFAELSRLSGVSEHYVATLAQTLEDRGYVARRKHGGIIFISRLVDKAIPPVPAPPPAPEPLAVPRLEALSKQASLLYSHVPAGSELNLQELVAISGLGKTYVGALARALEEKGYVVRRPQGNRIFVSRAAS